MKFLFMFSAIALSLGLFYSCDFEPTTTSLDINIKDELGNPVSGAEVKLYLEFSDLQAGIDQIGTTKTTDEYGNVHFTDLSPVKYYWFAEKDCLNNYNGGVTTTENLTEGVNNTVNCIVSPTGTIKLISNSSNPYKVYFNGTFVFDINGGATKYSFYRPTGSYSIRVLQISGYLLYPTDITYNGTLDCGETLTVSFPDK